MPPCWTAFLCKILIIAGYLPLPLEPETLQVGKKVLDTIFDAWPLVAFALGRK
jgi:hypothetical protein